MAVSRVIEIQIFDSTGQQIKSHEFDVSTDFMSSKYPKRVYVALRQCIEACMTGGIVSMRGVLKLT